MKALFTFVYCFLILNTKAWAWGDLGHAVIGEIAQRNLTPQGKALIQDLLGIEPLGVVATWADHMRDDKRFRPFGDYHFFQTDKDSLKSVTPLERQKRDADTMIGRAPDLIVSPTSGLNKEQKRILLRYFVHIVGDIHQPLHVGYSIDRGGNLCSVYFPTSTRPMSLHEVWDFDLLAFIEFGSKKASKLYYPKLTELVLEQYKTPIPITDTPADWYEEARNLLPQVYPDKVPTLAENRAYCKTAGLNGQDIGDNKAIPTIDGIYIDRASAIIKKQLWLGGLRLAHLLNQMGEKYKADSAVDEDKLIQGIFIENDAGARAPQSEIKKSSL